MELPETSLLVAFDAVARHRSFRKAADELHLTPSAVSHRLKTLETQLGRPLLNRTTRTVEPTLAGTQLLAITTTVLAKLHDACQALKDDDGTVTIVTTDSVATLWLIQRLPDIADQAHLEIHVHTRPAGFSFDSTNDDFAIVYGRPAMWPDGDPLLIADEIITPVCSPALASTITQLGDLWELPLLGDQNLHIDWPAFAEHAHVAPKTAATVRTSITFNHSHLALRAAAAGQGVALASSPLADDALSRNELIAPLTEFVRTGNGYYLVANTTRTTNTTRRFREAFKDQMASRPR